MRSRLFRKDGYEHFKVRLYLVGSVAAVRQVDYQLHATFPNPHRVITDSKDGFHLDIWTWGEFDIPITVKFGDGTTKDFVYSLAYSDELPPNDSDYTCEGPSRSGGSS